MPYVFCENCGRFYKLKESYSPKDFARKCGCGGYLNYIQNFDIQIIDKIIDNNSSD